MIVISEREFFRDFSLLISNRSISEDDDNIKNKNEKIQCQIYSLIQNNK